MRIEDEAACDRFVLLALTALDPGRPSPDWIRRRLQVAGIRSISLAVDVTNYVMLELGQPLHAYDRDALTGEISVRRAAEGEKLRTLDDVERALHPEDLVIADDSGAIGLAGVMGGASTEIDPSTSQVLLEAAHFTPSVVSRSARRHALLSEASRRFERGVDRGAGPRCRAAGSRPAGAIRRSDDRRCGHRRRDRACADRDRHPRHLPVGVVGYAYTVDESSTRYARSGCDVARPR